MAKVQKGYRLSASTGLHKGDREYQQDQVALLKHPRIPGCLLGVVADGMGGRSGGRKASDQVLMTARQIFEGYSPHAEDASTVLAQIIAEAHIVIKLTAISAEQEPHSTIAAFLINPDGNCHWAHAGDSRIYHFHGERMIHRTMDHSYVQALVDRGDITEEEAQSHPQSNILMGCLGMDTDPPVDSHFIPRLRIGDTLMACSDGIWHYFAPSELASILSALSPREACEFIIEKARARGHGGGDNMSLVVVKVEPLSEEASPAPTDAKRREDALRRDGRAMS